MPALAFRKWLNFEEAARYLTKHTGQNFTSEDIDQAAQGNAISAYFFTSDDLYLYLDDRAEETYNKTGYTTLAESHSFLNNYDDPEAQIAEIAPNTPIPIDSYSIFKDLVLNRIHISCPAGINVYDSDRKLLGGAYKTADNGCPVSITDTEFEILVKMSELNNLVKTCPTEWSEIKKPVNYMITVTHSTQLDGDFDLIENSIGTPFVDSCITDRLFSRYLKNKSKGTPKEEPANALKTISYLTLLAAELSQELDALKKKNNYKRSDYTALHFGENNRPNMSKIAKRLSELAIKRGHAAPDKSGNITAEHGYKHSGFQECISAAMKQEL